jgi:hypothetical protein
MAQPENPYQATLSEPIGPTTLVARRQFKQTYQVIGDQLIDTTCGWRSFVLLTAVESAD